MRSEQSTCSTSGPKGSSGGVKFVIDFEQVRNIFLIFLAVWWPSCTSKPALVVGANRPTVSPAVSSYHSTEVVWRRHCSPQESFHPLRSTPLVQFCWPHPDDLGIVFYSTPLPQNSKNAVASGLFPWFCSLLSSLLTHQLQKPGCCALGHSDLTLLMFLLPALGKSHPRNRLGGSVPFLLFIAVLITLFIFPCVVFIILVHEFLSSSILHTVQSQSKYQPK